MNNIKNPLESIFEAPFSNMMIQYLNELGSAQIIGRNRVIFKISGNRYRLIVEIDYKIGLVDIRFLGTYMEYDKVNALEV